MSGIRVHEKIGISIDLYVSDCPGCGVLFGIPTQLEARRREDGQSFYCPNGHSMSFGQSEADKLRTKLKQAENARDFWKREEETERARRQQVERSLAAKKGQVTKLRKRIVAGACPFGCRRHFANVERHITKMHPGAQLEAEHDGE